MDFWIDPISEEEGVFYSRFEPMRMKTKSLLLLFIIWFLSLGGMVQAQQEKKQGEMTGMGQSSSEYQPYMGGKEHYLANSPNYMAGKKHYLQGDPFSNAEKIGQGKKEIPLSRGEMKSNERNNSEEQGGGQVQININVIPDYSPKGYGVIYLPVIRPEHPKSGVNPPPHADPNHPHAGQINPSASGGFHQGTINLR